MPVIISGTQPGNSENIPPAGLIQAKKNLDASSRVPIRDISNLNKQQSSIDQNQKVKFKVDVPSTIQADQRAKKSRPDIPKVKRSLVLAQKFGVNQKLPLDSVDQDDLTHPRYSAEYISDIVSHYRNLLQSRDYSFNPHYMALQKDITSKMRELLVDWLSQIHHRFQLSAATFFLGVSLLDRFLSVSAVKRDKLQLVGCATMWIASKYEDIYAPEIDDFVKISDEAFSYDDMIKSEKYILESLDYKLCGPTIYTFTRRYLKVMGCTVRCQHLVSFLTELIQQTVETFTISLDKLAAGIVWFGVLVERFNMIENKENLPALVLETFKNSDDSFTVMGWSDDLQRITGYSEDDLFPVMSLVRDLVLNNKVSKHRSVATRYSSPKFDCVSQFSFDIEFCSDLESRDSEDMMEE